MVAFPRFYSPFSRHTDVTVYRAAKRLDGVPELVVYVILTNAVRVSLRQEYFLEYPNYCDFVINQRPVASRHSRQWNTNDTFLVCEMFKTSKSLFGTHQNNFAYLLELHKEFPRLWSRIFHENEPSCLAWTRKFDLNGNAKPKSTLDRFIAWIFDMSRSASIMHELAKRFGLFAQNN